MGKKKRRPEERDQGKKAYNEKTQSRVPGGAFQVPEAPNLEITIEKGLLSGQAAVKNEGWANRPSPLGLEGPNRCALYQNRGER